MAACRVTQCGKKTHARGFCNNHYEQRRNGGEFVIPPKGPIERFWLRVDRDGPVPEARPELGPCWIWTGSTTRGGYGQHWNGIKQRKTHAMGYELLVGPIPPGLELDHLCRVRVCCNPQHLEPVTGLVNQARGHTVIARNLAKVACDNGHGFTPGNTYLDKSGNRNCRTCRTEAMRRYRARRRATEPR